MTIRILFLPLSVVFISGCIKDEVNKPPVVDAGPYQNISAYKISDSVRLIGFATDADGSVVSYHWSEVSGPNTPTITTPGSSTTYIRGFVSGNYTFQLTATDDKGAVGVDAVSIKMTIPSCT